MLAKVFDVDPFAFAFVFGTWKLSSKPSRSIADNLSMRVQTRGSNPWSLIDCVCVKGLRRVDFPRGPGKGQISAQWRKKRLIIICSSKPFASYERDVQTFSDKVETRMRRSLVLCSWLSERIQHKYAQSWYKPFCWLRVCPATRIRVYSQIVGSSYSSHSPKAADRGISRTTVHPHSDVGCSLAATFDASSSSETASSHISD